MSHPEFSPFHAKLLLSVNVAALLACAEGNRSAGKQRRYIHKRFLDLKNSGWLI